MKKATGAILIILQLFTFSGCYTSYQRSMDQFVAERSNDEKSEFRIESVVLSDSTNIIFNEDMATFDIDSNIISGVDVNNISHYISGDEVIIVNINNSKHKNFTYGILLTIIMIGGSIYLINTITL
jgi:hypothetical protein